MIIHLGAQDSEMSDSSFLKRKQLLKQVLSQTCTDGDFG